MDGKGMQFNNVNASVSVLINNECYLVRRLRFPAGRIKRSCGVIDVSQQVPTRMYLRSPAGSTIIRESHNYFLCTSPDACRTNAGRGSRVPPRLVRRQAMKAAVSTPVAVS